MDTIRPPTTEQTIETEQLVRDLGGDLLEDPCRAEELPAVPQHGVPEGYTSGCGGQCRVALPYARGGKAGFAALCVNCDGVHRMPLHRQGIAP